MKIPAEIQISSTIRSGSVFYFPEEALSSDEPHYFVVVNHNPLTDEVLILVCSSSQIHKVKRRIQRRSFPETTAVEIRKNEYPDFTKDSIIDCNEVFPRSVAQLIEKLEQGELKLKSVMDSNLVERLRQAVLESPKVPNELKEKYLR